MDINVRRANVQGDAERALRVTYTLWGGESDLLVELVARTLPELANDHQDAEQAYAIEAALGIKGEFADLFRDVAAVKKMIWDESKTYSTEDLKELLSSIALTAATMHALVAQDDPGYAPAWAVLAEPLDEGAHPVTAEEARQLATGEVDYHIITDTTGQSIMLRVGSGVLLPGIVAGQWSDSVHEIKEFDRLREPGVVWARVENIEGTSGQWVKADYLGVPKSSLPGLRPIKDDPQA